MYEVRPSKKAEDRLCELIHALRSPDPGPVDKKSLSAFNIHSLAVFLLYVDVITVVLSLDPLEASGERIADDPHAPVHPDRLVCFNGFYVFIRVDDENDICYLLDIDFHAIDAEVPWGDNFPTMEIGVRINGLMHEV